MLRRRLTLILLSAAFAALFLFPSFTALLTDWWWFGEIGYRIVFTRELTTRVLLFLAAGGLAFGVLYLNLRAAQRGLVPNPVVLQLGPEAQPVDISAALRRLSLPLSLGFGLLAGFAATPAWDLVLRVIYRTPFGIADPVFSRDIGFYVFTLPALAAVLGFLTTLAVISLLLLIPLYWMRGDIVARPPRLMVEPSAGLHLALLLAAMFLLTAAPAVAGGHSRSAVFHHWPADRCQLHRPARPAAGPAGLGGGGGPRRGCDHDRRDAAATATLRSPGRRGLPCRGLPGARSLPPGGPEVRGGTHRADPRDAVSPVSHRRHPSGVGAGQRGSPRAGPERPGSRWPTSGPMALP